MPALEHLTIAINGDHPTEWTCSSRTRAETVHKQELRAYRGIGRCSCEFYCFKLEPIIRRNITPEQAVIEGMIKLRPGQKLKDSLRCDHLIESRDNFTDLMIQAIDQAEKAHGR